MTTEIGCAQVEEAISSLGVMMAFFDCEFNFIRVNQAYAAAASKKPADFVGKNHFALYPNVDNEAVFRHVLNTGEPYIVRAKPFEHPDQPERGTTYWDWRLQRLFEGGNSLGLVLILIDVTDHVCESLALNQAYKVIVDKETHYQNLFNNVSDAIFVLSLDEGPSANHVIDVNNLACQRLGYTKTELIGLTPSQLNVPGYPEKQDEIWYSLMHHGKALFETLHLTKDGRHIPTEVNLQLLQKDGKTLIYSVARDIAERKVIENQNRQSEKYTLALLNATSESSFLLDRDGMVLAVNDTALRRLHLQQGDILGKDVFVLIPSELAATRRVHFLEAIRSRKPISAEDERDGVKFVSTYTPILDDMGEVMQVAVYGIDVTDQRQLEAIEQVLPAVNHLILEGVPLQEVLDMICKKTTEAFGLALAWAGKKMEDGSIMPLASEGSAQAYFSAMQNIGVRWDDTPQGRGTAGSAIRLGETQYRRSDDAHPSSWTKIAAEHGIKATLAVPLILRGNIYGVFCLYSIKATQFESLVFRKRITALADKIRLAIEMAAEHEQIMLLSTALSSAGNAVMITDPRGRIEWVNPAFAMLSGYSSVELIGATPGILKSGKQDTAYYQQLWSTILAGNVWSSDTTEKRKDGTLYTVQQTITPIIAENGEITHFVSIHEDVTSKLEILASIQHTASHDGLTGLPNRRLFFDRLGQLFNLAKRNQTSLALMFIDLDGFKSINDKLGHHIGDLLLKGVAERLQACMRDSDTVARMGGDEFTIILFDISGRNNIESFANKVLGELSRPFNLEGHVVSISSSIGIAAATPIADSQVNEDMFIERADAAMYEAKRAGKNGYRFAQAIE
ncbi:MAG: diguanylate cyclase [Sulfuriferula sp.]